MISKRWLSELELAAASRIQVALTLKNGEVLHVVPERGPTTYQWNYQDPDSGERLTFSLANVSLVAEVPAGIQREISAGEAFLRASERTEWVEIVLRDGRVLQGNVIRNPIRHTGIIVNAVEETRHDFDIDDVMAVRKVIDPRHINGEPDPSKVTTLPGEP